MNTMKSSPPTSTILSSIFGGCDTRRRSRHGQTVGLSDRRTVARWGLTLLELIVSMAVATLILAGLGSVMLLAGRAMPEARSPANTAITAAGAADQLATEVQYAVSVMNRSATLIDFTVADRDGNAVPERIRYEWSGVAGDPLTRQYNGGRVVGLLAGVRTFSLSYDLETFSHTTPTQNESAQTLLINYNDTHDLADYSITNVKWYAQYFRPTLPADALSWKVTRVQFYAKQAGLATGQYKVQLQWPTAGNLPSGQVVEGMTLNESLLPLLYLTQQCNFTNASGLPPGQGLCLVFVWVSGTEACYILGQERTATAPNMSLLKSADSGVVWSQQTDQSLLFWVYGTVSTAGQPQVQTTRCLRRADIRLGSGDGDGSTVYTGVTLLNRPEVTP